MTAFYAIFSGCLHPFFPDKTHFSYDGESLISACLFGRVVTLLHLSWEKSFFLQEKSPFPKWNRAFVDDAGIEPATR